MVVHAQSFKNPAVGSLEVTVSAHKME